MPLVALSNTLLFHAIIAFAAIHRSKTHAPALSKVAERFHENCVKRLIDLDEISGADGNALAAVCLLRSYELLAEDRDPNRHLSGAYALAAVGIPDFREASLLKAGFFVSHSSSAAGGCHWTCSRISKADLLKNYLREDITYALIHRCQLKIDTQDIAVPTSALNDEDQLNIASLHLADTINKTFSAKIMQDQTQSVRFSTWKTFLPAQFTPYYESNSTTGMLAFPTIRMMSTSHVSVLQYCLVTETLQATMDERRLNVMEENAIRLCGLAFSSDSPSVYVNSFGPMSFCCRYLRQGAHQTELVRRLYAVRESTGWPVKRMVDELKLHWNEMEP